MTENEKRLYNLYLSTSRSSRNKPFKIREDFDGFDKTPEYNLITKISYFFNKFPQIKPEIYFKAPFIIYPDQEYIPLEYFTTQKAIKAYSVYMKQKEEESPDSDDHLEFIRNSLRYIGIFCAKEKIPVNDYLVHKSGITYTWMQHFRRRDICIYSLFELPNLIESIQSIPEDEKSLLLGGIGKDIYSYKQRYMMSNKAKVLVKDGTKKIIEFVDRNINKVG